MTKAEAIEYCFSLIKPSEMDAKDYNKFKLIRNRFNKGEAKEKAIKTMFEYFGVKENCYYTIEPTESDNSK